MQHDGSGGRCLVACLCRSLHRPDFDASEEADRCCPFLLGDARDAASKSTIVPGPNAWAHAPTQGGAEPFHCRITCKDGGATANIFIHQ